MKLKSDRDDKQSIFWTLVEKTLHKYAGQFVAVLLCYVKFIREDFMIARNCHNTNDTHLLAAIRGERSAFDLILKSSKRELQFFTGVKVSSLPIDEFEDIIMETLLKLTNSELSQLDHPWAYYRQALKNCFRDIFKKKARGPLFIPIDEVKFKAKSFEPRFNNSPQFLAKMVASSPIECLIILAKMYGLTIAESYEIYVKTVKLLKLSKTMSRSGYADLVLRTCEAKQDNLYFNFLSCSCSTVDLEACFEKRYPRIYQFLLSKLHKAAA